MIALTNRAEASTNANNIKAALVSQFAKYTAWPDLTAAEITLCIFGQHPINRSLERFENKKIHRRRLKIVYLSSNEQIKQQCQIIFFTYSEPQQATRFFATVANQPILTISDRPNFMADGGMIGLVQQGLSQRFMINNDITDTANLKLSSKLLQLALPLPTN